MTSSRGRIALVGSGEYTTAMQAVENQLLGDGVTAGKEKVFVQIPLAAGEESATRIEYWRRLGAEQANRLGVQQEFLPILNRQDAERSDFAAIVESAALVYFSGGNPRYLAESLVGTAVGNAVASALDSGTSVAGCSAGAMAFGPTVPHIRGLPHHRTEGLKLVPHIEVLPHYDKYFKHVADSWLHALLANDGGAFILGIDENTALISLDGDDWQVHGHGRVHILKGGPTASYAAGTCLTLAQP